MKLSTRLTFLSASVLITLFAAGTASLAQDGATTQMPIEGGGDCCYTQTSAPLNERVLVVYNNNIPESRDVANYYATRRGIPAANLLDISPSSDSEISWSEYLNVVKGKIQTKLDALGRRNILYIVFSYRTPYRIPDVPAVGVDFNCTDNPRCRYGTALDQFVADIWDQTQPWVKSTELQAGNAYYAPSRSAAPSGSTSIVTQRRASATARRGAAAPSPRVSPSRAARLMSPTPHCCRSTTASSKTSSRAPTSATRWRATPPRSSGSCSTSETHSTGPRSGGRPPPA